MPTPHANDQDDILASLLAEAGFTNEDSASLAHQPRLDRDVAAPLSSAQQRLWFLQQLAPQDASYNNSLALHFSGKSLACELNADALAHTLHALQMQQEQLITYFADTAEGPRQCVDPHASVPLGRVDQQHIDIAAWPEAMQSIIRDMSALPFSLDQAPLMRAVLVRGPNIPVDTADTAQESLDKAYAPQYLLVLTLHHLISDGWSNGVLMQAFQQLYPYFVHQLSAEGSAHDMPDVRPAIQYRDFAAWEQAEAQQQARQQHLNWWKDYLADAPEYINLPYDAIDDTPSALSTEAPGQRQRISLTAQQMRQLDTFCQQQQLRRFDVLLSAWQWLLHVISGDAHIVTGVPNANRHHADTQDIIGCFINMQAHVAHINSTMTLHDRFMASADTRKQIAQHHDVPFDQVLQQLELSRDGKRTPLFQNVLNYQRIDAQHAVQTLSGDDFNVDIIWPEEQFAKYELSLDIREQASADGSTEDTLLSLEYRADLFSETRIQQWLDQYVHLLMQSCDSANTHTPLARINTLTQAQHTRLQQNAFTEGTQSLDSHWLTRFTRQVTQQPDAIVVSSEVVSSETHAFTQQETAQIQQLSYAQVHQRSEQLAQHILYSVAKQHPQHNPPSDLLTQVVALHMPRCCDWLVACIAVMKTGAAFLSIDPTLPEARKQHILQHSQAVACVELTPSASEIASTQQQESGAHWCQVYLSDIDDEAQHHEANAVQLPLHLTQQVHQSAPAYVIFTSGSTGTPKGPIVTQQGMLNNQLAKITPLTLSEDDVIAQTAPQSFDISIWQLLTAPIIGARTHIISRESVQDPLALLAQIKQQQVTQVELVPSQIGLLLDILDDERVDNEQALPDAYSPTHLRWLMSIGEALPITLVQRWFAYFNHIPVMNAYGPAECADNVAFQPIYAHDMPHTAHISTNGVAHIGLPTENAALYVVNVDAADSMSGQQIRQVPPGSIGQLAVSGIGVGLGYIHDTQRTQAVFIDNPFAQQHAQPALHQRLYLTGDLVRQCDNGSLAFIGRNDFQVKIRGQRIELGEIEAVLQAQTPVKHALVSVFEQHLVAYVVLDAHQNTTTVSDTEHTPQHVLHQALQATLPEYMRPTYILLLDALPLNPNGKVNRKALPTPQADDNNASMHSVQKSPEPIASDDVLMQQIAEIWQQLLDQPVNDQHANFFSLGGHSLLAARCVTQVRQHVGLQHANQLGVKSVFDAPTLSAFCAHVNQVLQASASEETQESHTPAEQPNALPASLTTNISTTESLPLAAIQERIWVLEQLEGGKTWLMPSAWHIHGDVDVATLTHAFNDVIALHAGLRASFYTNAHDLPKQRIHAQCVMNIQQQHITSEAALRAAIQHNQTQPFDLQRPPLIRASLLHCNFTKNDTDTTPAEHVLLVAMHHIVADHQSAQQLMSDLQTAWRLRRLGQPVPHTTPVFGYQAWVSWNAARKHDAHYQAQQAESLTWWQAQLPAPQPVLNLPSDQQASEANHHNNHHDNRGGSVTREINGELLQHIHSFCQQANSETQQVTLFDALLASYALLLHRLSEQSAIRIGIPVSERHQLPAERAEDAQQLVGCLLNTTLVPLTIDESLDAQQWVSHVSARHAEVKQHQDVPFEQLVSHLQQQQQLQRDTQHTPLFQALFNLVYHQQDANGLDTNAMQITPFATQKSVAKFMLSLDIVVHKEALVVCFEYAADRFSQPIAEGFADQWVTLLSQLVQPTLRQRNAPLASFENLSNAQTQQIRQWELSTTRVSDDSLNDAWLTRFKRHVARRPSAIAISSDQHTPPLTYAQLAVAAEQRAAAIWQALSATGQHAQQQHHASLNHTLHNSIHEPLIAVLCQRDVDYLITLVACQYLCVPWMPLDPAQPPARWQQVLQQADAQLLIVDDSISAANRASLSTHRALSIVDIDTLNLSNANLLPTPIIDAHRLAYVLFTSGSTGTPKGVMITQQGMLNNILAKVEPLDLHEGVVIAQSAPQCFDISVWQCLAALIVGGQIHQISTDVMRNPLQCVEQLQQARVNIFEPVPSWINALLDELDEQDALATFDAKTLQFDASTLTHLLSTGEALSPALAARWLQRFPHVPLVNAYGPAECSDDVAFAHIATPPEDLHQPLPIGAPTANAQLIVIDSQQRRVNVGVPGQLAIAGKCVGRGYRHDEARTEAVFVPHIDKNHSPQRMYLTGDRVKRLPNGDLQYLGRMDFQLKIRGQRLEPGEIEAVIEQLEGIKQAVVVAKNINDQAHLLAYIVTEASHTLEQDTIQTHVIRHVSDQLPQFMVPSAVITLEALPLNANGKVDRTQLMQLSTPALAAASNTSNAAATSLQTAHQQQLANIWSTLLNVPVTQLHTNSEFFQLGGHSLLATRLMNRIQREWSLTLPLKRIFEQPTLGALAAQIEQLTADETSPNNQTLPALRAVSRAQALPLSFAQQRLWSVQQLNPEENSAYNMCGQLAIEGALSASAWQQALNQLVSRHEVLRTGYVMPDDEHGALTPQLLIAAAESSEVPVQLHDLQTLTPEQQQQQIAQLAQQEAKTPFDLTQPMMLRAQVICLAPTRYHMLVTVHHIASDGWSTAIMVDEIVSLYNGLRRQTTQRDTQPCTRTELPELPIQYADFAYWQHQCLQGDYLTQLARWWQDYLADAPALLAIPTDFPRPEQQDTRGDAYKQTLSHALTQQLREFSTTHHVSLYMLMLTAYYVTLSALNKQTATSHSATTSIDDLVIGTDLAGRLDASLENLVGCFVNVLPVRARIDASQTLLDTIKATKENCLSMFEHQAMPFDLLVEQLNPERSNAYNPIVQSLFVMQNTPTERYELDDLHITPVDSNVKQAKFDLALFVEESADTIHINWLYARALFRRKSVQHFATVYQAVCEHIVNDASATLDGLSLPEKHNSISNADTLPEKSTQQVSSKRNKFSKLKKKK